MSIHSWSQANSTYINQSKYDPLSKNTNRKEKQRLRSLHLYMHISTSANIPYFFPFLSGKFLHKTGHVKHPSTILIVEKLFCTFLNTCMHTCINTAQEFLVEKLQS